MEVDIVFQGNGAAEPDACGNHDMAATKLGDGLDGAVEGFSVEELEQLMSFTERVNKNMEKMISEE